jgi:hypothetical protein
VQSSHSRVATIRKPSCSSCALPIGGWVGALLLGISACGGAAISTIAVALPKTPRRPDGVVIEPTAALPAPSEHARARGVVSLREPLSEEAVRDVVRSYFEAFEHEDLGSLQQLLTLDAMSLDANVRGGRTALLKRWEERMGKLGYAKIAGVEVVQIDRVERFDFDDLSAMSTPPRPPEMQPGEALVRVSVIAPTIAGERFFPDAVTLLLRRESGKFKIAAVGEVNPP